MGQARSEQLAQSENWFSNVMMFGEHGRTARVLFCRSTAHTSSHKHIAPGTWVAHGSGRHGVSVANGKLHELSTQTPVAPQPLTTVSPAPTGHRSGGRIGWTQSVTPSESRNSRTATSSSIPPLVKLAMAANSCSINAMSFVPTQPQSHGPEHGVLGGRLPLHMADIWHTSSFVFDRHADDVSLVAHVPFAMNACGATTVVVDDGNRSIVSVISGSTSPSQLVATKANGHCPHCSGGPLSVSVPRHAHWQLSDEQASLTLPHASVMSVVHEPVPGPSKRKQRPTSKHEPESAGVAIWLQPSTGSSSGHAPQPSSGVGIGVGIGVGGGVGAGVGAGEGGGVGLGVGGCVSAQSIKLPANALWHAHTH